MFDEKFVTFFNTPGLLSLVGVPIVVDKADFPAIHIAAQNLAADFAKVTRGSPSPLQHVTEERDGFKLDAEACIIVGSIKASPIIRYLEQSGNFDCSKIRGKWESYKTAIVDNPFNGCRKALVIAGSDKRGATFGAYALSAQIGVSPYDLPSANHGICLSSG
jgi:hypothetical protein